MIDELKKIITEDRIRSRYIDLVSFASDAGFYHLVPKAVVQPVSEAEIVSLFQFSHLHKIPLVFRAGGTSLSGQSITDGILVELSQYWNKIQVQDNGNVVRVQPGITGAMVNAHLKNYRRKIGPDPSSINAAMMGGILSNNSSGMCCGVILNSYHTTKYIRFVLPNGHIYTTEKKEDYDRFERDCNDVFNTLTQLRETIQQDEDLYHRIRQKYQTKNTVGYSLNAFIDYTHPLEILAHLLIGAEGTLGFIAEAVMDTVPDYAFKATALLYFPNIFAACEAIVPLTRAGALMVELMDRASLHAVENMDGMPALVKTLPDGASALLVEFQENDLDELKERVNRFLSSTTQLNLYNNPVFTFDATEQAFLWKVRKGLFPAVGAVRASGTTVILEDIAFPVEALGAAILDLQQLFVKHHYHNAIIFGHAKDGNLHFVVTQSFNSENEITRYDLFIRDVVDLVVKKYNGSLKAEHGTGRNMAPFVETEWGSRAYEIMKQLKMVIDPNHLLNPGVIINVDKNAHIKNLKDLPSVEEEVDRCIECGYCEHRCPSRDITTTPRRRIVIRRALKNLQIQGDIGNYNKLLHQYQYDGIETCAVDGLCATACPVDINTGDLIKRLRKENHSPLANRVALIIAKNFQIVEGMLRAGVRLGVGLNTVLGPNAMFNITRSLKRIFPGIPIWSLQITRPPSLDIVNKPRQINTKTDTRIIYFPACISRMLGSYAGKTKNLLETFMSICDKSGIGVETLDKLRGSCCSQMYSSKGFREAYAYSANRIVEQLWRSSNEGRLSIVTDVSSCAYTLQKLGPALTNENLKKYKELTIMDSVEFLYEMVLPFVEVKARKQDIVLHPVCSLEKMKLENKFTRVASHFAEKVTVPQHAGCCGMAGDRGFLFPELTASATKDEALEVSAYNYSGYYSSTKTCEMAMSAAVSKNYESILYLVDECI